MLIKVGKLMSDQIFGYRMFSRDEHQDSRVLTRNHM